MPEPQPISSRWHRPRRGHEALQRRQLEGFERARRARGEFAVLVVQPPQFARAQLGRRLRDQPVVQAGGFLRQCQRRIVVRLRELLRQPGQRAAAITAQQQPEPAAHLQPRLQRLARFGVRCAAGGKRVEGQRVNAK